MAGLEKPINREKSSIKRIVKELTHININRLNVKKKGGSMDKLTDFAKLVEAQTFERLNRMHGNKVDWSRDSKATIKPGKKYTKVDVGHSGKFMVDKDGNIFGIKAYGVIHRGKHYGTLDTINQYFWGEYAPMKRKEA